MNNVVQGQKVVVGNTLGTVDKERIFLTKTTEGKFICVHKADEDKYKDGGYFRVGVWSFLNTKPSNVSSFKYGEEVFVSNGGIKYERRIFVGAVGERFLTVVPADVEKFRSGSKNFKTGLWNLIKKAPVQLTREQALQKLSGNYEIID